MYYVVSEMHLAARHKFEKIIFNLITLNLHSSSWAPRQPLNGFKFTENSTFTEEGRTNLTKKQEKYISSHQTHIFCTFPSFCPAICTFICLYEHIE